MTHVTEQKDRDYYLSVAKAVAQRSTCYLYKEGAVLVTKDNRIASTGYNGAVHGCIDCWEKGICSYEAETGEVSDCSQEQCLGLRAEINALLNAHRDDTKDSVLYIFAEDRKTGKSIPVNIDGVVGHIIQACNVKDIVTEVSLA